MIMLNTFKEFNEAELSNGVYIVAMHATRIPPHIGLIIDKQYHSLSIKGQDFNTPVKALLKNIEQRKIPSLFIKIKSHTTFSHAYLKEHFILNIQQFPRVDKDVATCLSPIKLFFNEVYDVGMDDVDFLFHLLPKLQATELLEHTTTLFIDEKKYQLPVYTKEELDTEIENARKEIVSTTSLIHTH
jgi:hypothetical protein